jgi:hypothetical protein
MREGMCVGVEYTVYMHINKTNNKKYVGITRVDPVKRWSNGNGYTKNNHFHKAIEKYGWDGFEHEILFEKLTKNDARKKEAELILEHQSFNRNYGYNLTYGGECGDATTEETREKMRKANTGKHHSEETRQKIGKASAGRRHTEEARQKMSKVWSGVRRSKETRQKMSEARKGQQGTMLGKTHSLEARQKISNAMSGENNPMFGKTLSLETKQKIREARIGKKQSESTRQKIREANSGKRISEATRQKMSNAQLAWRNNKSVGELVAP